MSKVLVIGEPGAFLTSVMAALTEFGAVSPRVWETDSLATGIDRGHLADLAEPFDTVLFVAQEGRLEQLEVLKTVCQTNDRLIIPGVCMGNRGITGSFRGSEKLKDWESVWRAIRISASNDEASTTDYRTKASYEMLANIMAAEWQKIDSERSGSAADMRIYLLQMDTGEGGWHPVRANPAVTGRYSARWLKEVDFAAPADQDPSGSEDSDSYFEGLTAGPWAIFHRWGEGRLKQLPLAQCLVQAADPLSEGLAGRLPERICSGFTHAEAQHEAGLLGIEDYVGRMLSNLEKSLFAAVGDNRGFIGVGAGFSMAEGICRGLQKCLNRVLEISRTMDCVKVEESDGVSMDCGAAEESDGVSAETGDRQCLYYLQALTIMRGKPHIAVGQRTIYGFPVMQVSVGERWYEGVGLNRTCALRNALKTALEEGQNSTICSCEGAAGWGTSLSASLCRLDAAMQVLKNRRCIPRVFEVTMEPLLRKEAIRAFGVLLHEEENEWEPK